MLAQEYSRLGRQSAGLESVVEHSGIAIHGGQEHRGLKYTVAFDLKRKRRTDAQRFRGRLGVGGERAESLQRRSAVRRQPGKRQCV